MGIGPKSGLKNEELAEGLNNAGIIYRSPVPPRVHHLAQALKSSPYL